MINDPACEGCHRETPDNELFRCSACGHRCCDDCTNHPGDDAGPCVDCEAAARKKLDASGDPKWTPERAASLRRVIESARAFVKCADEFVPGDGSSFHPGALDEYSAALDDALAADGRAWDDVSGPPYRVAHGFVLVVEVPLSPDHAGTPEEAAQRVLDRCPEMRGVDPATADAPARALVAVRRARSLAEDIDRAFQEARRAWAGFPP